MYYAFVQGDQIIGYGQSKEDALLYAKLNFGAVAYNATVDEFKRNGPWVPGEDDYNWIVEMSKGLYDTVHNNDIESMLLQSYVVYTNEEGVAQLQTIDEAMRD